MAAAASEGEVAVADMVHAARQVFEAMRQGADAARTEALHAVYEQQWARVREAAVALDHKRADENSTAQAAAMDVDSAELDELLQQRNELRSALAARNRELKEQIDRLRNLLCAVQVTT